jgi:cytochrome c551
MLKLAVPAFLIFTFITSACFQDTKKKDQSPKFKQYYAQGQALYQQHCSNCHQKDGKGLGRVYPPLDKSDFLANQQQVICIIKKGTNQPLVVNGIEYNMEMKGNPQLTELDIAEITTYIYNSWSNSEGLIDVTQVTKVLAQCKK